MYETSIAKWFISSISERLSTPFIIKTEVRKYIPEIWDQKYSLKTKINLVWLIQIMVKWYEDRSGIDQSFKLVTFVEKT